MKSVWGETRCRPQRATERGDGGEQDQDARGRGAVTEDGTEVPVDEGDRRTERGPQIGGRQPLVRMVLDDRSPAEQIRRPQSYEHYGGHAGPRSTA